MPPFEKGRYVARKKNTAPVLEPVRKGTRLTGDARAQLAVGLARDYQAGRSIRALSASSGRSYGAVRRMLVDAGVALRGRGGRHEPADLTG